jgi:hypothetical protein
MAALKHVELIGGIEGEGGRATANNGVFWNLPKCRGERTARGCLVGTDGNNTAMRLRN